MRDRKKILELMLELAQNPMTRKAYDTNPQLVLTRFKVEGNAAVHLLNRNWKGLVEQTADVPFVISSNAFFSPRHRKA